jgi:hypothetical protein
VREEGSKDGEMCLVYGVSLGAWICGEGVGYSDR